VRGLKDAQQLVEAFACDFGHTSILNSGIDLHPIAQEPIFQAAKKPRVDIPQLFEARIA
jgi:hypothetical protein